MLYWNYKCYIQKRWVDAAQSYREREGEPARRVHAVGGFIFITHNAEVLRNTAFNTNQVNNVIT